MEVPAEMLLEGDTQPMDSQIYRNYEEKMTNQDDGPEQRKDDKTELTDHHEGEAPCEKELQDSRDDKSPTPPGWLQQEKNKTNDDLPELPSPPALPYAYPLPPITPGTTGKKRNRQGEVLTPATITPSAALKSLFDPAKFNGFNAANPSASLSQMFLGTQAQSSPVPNNMRSDPIFQRPSPNFQPLSSASPANVQSSPTKPVNTNRSSSPTGLRDAYTTIKESQIRREEQMKIKGKLAGITSVTSSDAAELEEDSLDNCTTAAEERVARSRRLAEIRQKALTKCEEFRAPKRLKPVRRGKRAKVAHIDSHSPVTNMPKRSDAISISDDESSPLSSNASSIASTDQNLKSGVNMVSGRSHEPSRLNGSTDFCASMRNGSTSPVKITTCAEENHLQQQLNAQLLPKESTVLIPQSQPVGDDVKTPHHKGSLHRESSNSKPLCSLPFQDGSAMSSSPPVLRGADHINQQHASHRSQNDHIGVGIPLPKHIENLTPEVNRGQNINRIDCSNNSMHALLSPNGREDPAQETQYEVPETDPPELLSSHRSIRRQSRFPSTQATINIQPVDYRRRISVISSNEQVQQRESSSTHYETAQTRITALASSHVPVKGKGSVEEPLPDQGAVLDGDDIAMTRHSKFVLRGNSAGPSPSGNVVDDSATIPSYSSPIPAARRRSILVHQKYLETPKSSSADIETSSISGSNNVQLEMEQITEIRGLKGKALQPFPVDKTKPNLAPVDEMNRSAMIRSDMTKSMVGVDTRSVQSLASVPLHNAVEQLSPLTAETAERAKAERLDNASSRVLALFKDRSLYYWPASCLGKAREDVPAYKVRFDDGVIDEVEAKNICLFDLRKGDIVKVDKPKLKRNNYVVKGFEKDNSSVHPNETDSSNNVGEDSLTDIYGNGTILLIAKSRHGNDDVATGINNLKRVPAASIYLTGTMWSHYKDRLLSNSDVGKRMESILYQSPKLQQPRDGSPLSRSRRTANSTPTNENHFGHQFGDIPVKARLFTGMAFGISYSGDELKRTNLISNLRKHGARVLDLDFDCLFSAKSVQATSFSTSSVSEALDDIGSPSLELNGDLRNTGFTALIAQEHSRRVKYLQALALGLPILHGRWVNDCVQADAMLPWKHYMLPAGKSTLLDGATISRTISTYDARSASLKAILEKRELILPNQHILLIGSHKSKKNDNGKGRGKKGEDEEHRQKQYAFLVCAMGASTVRRVKHLNEARAILQKGEGNWTHVHVDGGVDEAKKVLFSKGQKADRQLATGSGPASDVVILDQEYVLQSLILGRPIEEAGTRFLYIQ